MRGKKKLMIEALKKHLGVVTRACKQVEITYQTHYNWLKDNEEYKKEVEAIPNMVLDFVENALFKLIREGTPSAIIFFLKTKGRERGYIEKQEIESNIRLDMDTEKLREAIKNGVPYQ